MRALPVARLFVPVRAPAPVEPLFGPTGTQYTLTADSGSFTWTGSTANLEFNRTITAESGSFAWTGSVANLEFNRVF
jgi:hypothetical protein